MAKRELIHRRQLIKWSIPIAAGLPFVHLVACADKAKTKTDEVDSTKTRKTTARKNNEKQKPNTSEVLYYNQKKKVLHYPGLKEKEELHINEQQEIKIADWEQMLDSGQARFVKEKSGLAFEKLALRSYQANPTAENLQHSLTIVARAFSNEYAMHNRFNWRVHDLLAQLVALNDAVGDKWNYFTTAMQGVDMTKVKVPKRMKWVQSKDLFDKKAAYIAAHKNDYLARLKSRLI